MRKEEDEVESLIQEGTIDEERQSEILIGQKTEERAVCVPWLMDRGDDWDRTDRVVCDGMEHISNTSRRYRVQT